MTSAARRVELISDTDALRQILFDWSTEESAARCRDSLVPWSGGGWRMFCWSGRLRPECASIFLEDDGRKVDVGDSIPVFRDGSRESIRLGRLSSEAVGGPVHWFRNWVNWMEKGYLS